jgi:hypothetical protein
MVRPPARERQKLLSFLESLAADPFQKGDFEEVDEVGRAVQVRVIGLYALTFWADHPVSEVKVVKIQRADRR